MTKIPNVKQNYWVTVDSINAIITKNVKLFFA